MGPRVRKSGLWDVPSSTGTSRVAVTLWHEEPGGRGPAGGWPEEPVMEGAEPLGWGGVDRSASWSSSWSGPGAEAQALGRGQGFPLGVVPRDSLPCGKGLSGHCSE